MISVHDRRIDALKEHCDGLVVETASTVNMKRSTCERVLNDLVECDTLVVLDLDRAFRSVINAVQILEKLRRRGVH
ncbi:recombinase family protein [uncultured Roseobacter sp.]|uniref:recombinase family protein n=1 Tax=uncultured Roseobacter sp. TaxID=114847 RepID=UPI003456A9AD